MTPDGLFLPENAYVYRRSLQRQISILAYFLVFLRPGFLFRVDKTLALDPFLILIGLLNSYLGGACPI